MQIYNKKEKCSGCSACMNICPKKAITMKSDKEGFLYPEIDEEKCIHCNLCHKTCPYINPLDDKKVFKKEIYAVKHKDNDIRRKSSSGGVFTAISNYLLSKKAIVYGATYNEDMKVFHQRVVNEEERDKLRGSKYVQSELNNVFKLLKEDLLKDKKVLFVGTPCQVAGLYTFLNTSNIKNLNNLTTCDLICHGVPSPMLFKEHITMLSKNNKIKWYEFRSKINGWHSQTEVVTYKNNQIDYKSRLSQSYKNIFHSTLALRPSCYECPYAKIKRISDITIGDYWNIEKVFPDFDDNKGISLVIVNTKKGRDLFENIQDKLLIKTSNETDCLQPQLQHPVKRPTKRDTFWQDYYKHGYKYILRKYTVVGIRKATKQVLKNVLIKIHLFEGLRKLVHNEKEK